MRKEVWFGLAIMAFVVVLTFWMLPSPSQITQGHLGLLMLSLIVVAIMLGYPTAFTLMGMGIIFAFASYYMQTGGHTELSIKNTLDLMVQRAYYVMSNDVLISIPLFVFMGYLVERSNLIEKLFRSLHVALARIPASLAVASLVTCAVFATATGIVGAVVTLMGLLAFPAMLKAGYNVKVSAGVITAGGCLGILIPPSVMLIVYGATAGVSVVQLYAGAFFPGIMLAGLYIAYVMILAKIRPAYAPPLPESERLVTIPPANAAIAASHGQKAVPSLLKALRAPPPAGVPAAHARRQLLIALSPAIAFALLMGLTWHAVTKPDLTTDTSTITISTGGTESTGAPAGGLVEPPQDSGGLAEPPTEPTAADAPKQEAEAIAKSEQQKADKQAAEAAKPAPAADWVRDPTPEAFWIVLGVGALLLAVLYVMMTFVRLEIFKMLLASFFPLALLILAVLGSIVFGLATPTEAAAIGAFGGFALAAVYALVAKSRSEALPIWRTWIPLWLLFGISVVWFLLLKFEVLTSGPPLWMGWVSIIAIGVWCVVATWQMKIFGIVRESAFLTAKTSAMVCWLFVGSSIFSAAFALLGGQEIVERWVLSMGLTPVQFMIMAQVIIFLLGWPLEWTEIIVIFMPIFIPLLAKFNIDPLFFGLLVALNLQTAFLSPPVAMAAFYLKGVSPPHVTLNAIFAGMMPFMVIQVIALALLYVFPDIGLWLPRVLYK
jgi:TRAP-type mannitol/chloroaromatic compound transport system permease large subunit